ncbi:MAG TPA: hypothetical protein VFL90_19460 [Methylomirabilota bacterium]|nr:hypothetical protein [Methylomirabilota bacterium]
MTARRTVACLVLLLLALTPALGLASDDASAATVVKHQPTRLQHQPHRTWRAVATLPTVPPATPVGAASARLAAPDAPVAMPLVVHVPFVPPRT